MIIEEHKADLRITPECIELDSRIRKWFPRVATEIEVPLRDLVPRPENRGLLHIWKYGSCDIVVYLKNDPVAVFEPGGSHHWEIRQQRNDRRKYKLLDLNHVVCVNFMNNALSLSNRKLRALVGKAIYAERELF